MTLYRYRYEEAVEQNKAMVEEDMERAKGLEDTNTICHSDGSTKL